MEDKKLPEEQKSSFLKDVSKSAYEELIKPQAMDAVANMTSSVLYSFTDALTNVIYKIIYKNDKNFVAPTNSRQGRDKYSNVSRRNSQTQSRVTPRIVTNRPSDVLEYVYVDTYEKANSIKKDLVTSIERFGYARVGDLYEKVGILTSDTDFIYGWVNVSDIHYVPDRNGLWFNLPKPVLIKKR